MEPYVKCLAAPYFEEQNWGPGKGSGIESVYKPIFNPDARGRVRLQVRLSALAAD